MSAAEAGAGEAHSEHQTANKVRSFLPGTNLDDPANQAAIELEHATGIVQILKAAAASDLIRIPETRHFALESTLHALQSCLDRAQHQIEALGDERNRRPSAKEVQS